MMFAKPYRALLVILIVCVGSRLPAGERVTKLGPSQKESRVPAWDASGLGTLVWQGIACADLSDDGRFVAAGTIAPPGDPNVFLLDETGKVIGQYSGGKRWINEVAAGSAAPDGSWSFVAAVCSTAVGTPGHKPVITVFSKDKPETPDYPRTMVFHYGDHSNHAARMLASLGTALVVDTTDGLRWSNPPAKETVWGRYRGPDVTFAVSPSGRGVVGTAVTAKDDLAKATNLLVYERDKQSQQPTVWMRPVNRATDTPPKMEKGIYGPAVPAYDELEVYAPLAVAIDNAGVRVAAADYQGWVRWFRSDAGPRFGNRFMPARPAITVYDDKGKELRRFGPETFKFSFWCNLAFSADGSVLFAWPHSWTARGLAGQTILPADDNATRIYALGIADGSVNVIEFPDAITYAAVRPDGGLVAGCWNGRVYLLGPDYQATPPDGIDMGGPSLVDVSATGDRILVAGTNGVVRLLGPDGKELWQADLNKLATPGDKPWTKNQDPGKIAEGVWRTNGGLANSDMGGQYLVQAPNGLLLIDPNGGLSFEQNWARIKAAGLDPMTVKYVLPTHEHGDHCPAAYLWRVITGAKVVGFAEMAYGLQHQNPYGTDYGFNAPIPTDIVVTEDKTLDLAGLQVQVVRLPGHTYGSTGYVFEVGGKEYIAIGDVIMPGGTLGYFGSIDFSGADVLASMYKIAALRPDYILGGHGSGNPADFAQKGLDVGEATGWGKTTPPKPNPFYALKQTNYIVTAWREPIISACYPDADNDGKPDVAVSEDTPQGGLVKIYLNKGGSFAEQPSITVPLPGMRFRTQENKFRWGYLNDDKIPDLFPSNEMQFAILLSRNGKPEYDVTVFDTIRPGFVVPTDLNNDGVKDLVLGHRFMAAFSTIMQTAPGKFDPPRDRQVAGTYFDMQVIDVNKDEKDDLVLSGGEVFLRQADGSFAKEPASKMQTVDVWRWGWAADFNNDGWVEYAQAYNKDKAALVRIFENTHDPQRPFKEQPDHSFTVPGAGIVRDGPTVADWNADGIPDLILLQSKTGEAGGSGALVLLGGPQCISPDRAVSVPLDYAPHYDTKLGVGDFNGDGLPDLAGFGNTNVGVPGVYIWLQTKK
ncbi:MAG TPA: FG-GAP-like repeat-containing protein [Planctomycetota bacterium]|nr:FG-GAP-like repeat-containing protein [Planctomycetota bacterium]